MVAVNNNSFLHFLSPNASNGGWTQTFEWRAECFTTVPMMLAVKSNSFCHFLSTDVSEGGWTQTLNLSIMKGVFYHCANDASGE
jgi:hypothetical protein